MFFINQDGNTRTDKKFLAAFNGPNSYQLIII